MASSLGVEADVNSFSKSPKKRPARTSPPSLAASWSLKRSRSSPTTSSNFKDFGDPLSHQVPMDTQANEDALEHSNSQTDGPRDVTGPDQSPKAQ